MKRLLAFAAPALVALCFVGIASAQALPVPSGVTAFSAEEGLLVSWSHDNAPMHRVGWVNTVELVKARAAGNWLDAFEYRDVPADYDSILLSQSVTEDGEYWVIVGSGNAPSPTEIGWGRWRLITVDRGMDPDDAYTMAYVQQAIGYYRSNGRDATIEYYSLITEDRGVPSLGPDGRYLFLVDPANYVLLASPIHYLNNQVMRLIAPGGPFHAEVAQADEKGVWVQSLRPNVSTGQQEPARYFIVLHDGLLFMSAHQIIQENVEAATREYVNKAIGFYQQYGPLATESYYNSPASVEGQFYLFMTDENDIYIVHPIESERIGTDIKEVTDDAGNPLGQRIAQATEEGIWVEYYWPHPVTGEKELKTTWAIRYDGKIFASGYYTASPAWEGEDPWEFTQDYVRRAVGRYSNDGLESMKNYYNSVVSFEGQWYLFATDENDIYIVHPVFPHLRGTDIKALTNKDSAGNPLGESLAKAADGGEGIRVEYQWPHPITLVEAPKIAYAVRRDGILFASGYYPLPEDPRTYTQNYVAEAIAYYEKHGLAATVEYYRSKESVAEGVWFLALLDKDGKFLTHYVNDGLIGTDAEDYWSPDGTDVGRRMLASTEEGHWFQATFPNVRGAGDNHRITWAIRHDGLVFTSGYFGAPTEDPIGH